MRARIIVGIVAAGAVGLLLQAHPWAKPDKRSPKVQQLLSEQDRLNDICRDGRGADHGRAACKKRDQVEARLQKAGMCFGERGQAHYEMKWHLCSTPAPIATDDGAKASTLYRLAHPQRVRAESHANTDVAPAPNEDEIHYDSKTAVEASVYRQLVEDSEVCLDAQVTMALRAGMRSRRQIVDRVSPLCSTWLKKSGLETAEQAEAATEMRAFAMIDRLAADGRY